MSPRSVVVTGANRGIGLGLIYQFLKNPDIKHIIATARDVDKATELASINDPRLHIVPLTVTCDKSIDTFVSKVSDIVGDDGLNLLVNNAGGIIEVSENTPLRQVLVDQLNLNTVGVVVVAHKLLPLLQKAAANVSGSSLSVSRSAVITISSSTGSISQNNSGSTYGQSKSPIVLAYRMAKTAVNQFVKTLSVDSKDDHILSVAFCPGWVRTGSGGPNAPSSVEESTSVLVDSFYKLNEEHNGGYFQRDLKQIPY